MQIGEKGMGMGIGTCMCKSQIGHQKQRNIDKQMFVCNGKLLSYSTYLCNGVKLENKNAYFCSLPNFILLYKL